MWWRSTTRAADQREAAIASASAPAGMRIGAAGSVTARHTTHIAPGEVRHGTLDGPPDVRFLIGRRVFEPTDAAILVSLLPRVIHLRGAERLAKLVHLVHLVDDESRAALRARRRAGTPAGSPAD